MKIEFYQRSASGAEGVLIILEVFIVEIGQKTGAFKPFENTCLIFSKQLNNFDLCSNWESCVGQVLIQ